MLLYTTVTSLALLGLSYCQSEKDYVSPKPPFKSVPMVGFGTWRLEQSNAASAVSTAIQAGFRHFDGATAYQNQQWYGPGISDGLKKAGLKREDIFVASKIWANRCVSK
jgi:alcohol dehydrogenase (NADP+)